MGKKGNAAKLRKANRERERKVQQLQKQTDQDPPNDQTTGGQGSAAVMLQSTPSWIFSKIKEQLWIGAVLCFAGGREAAGMGEYAFASTLFVVSGLFLFLFAFSWQGVKDRPSITKAGRMVAAIAGIAFIPLSVAWVYRYKGDKPWSIFLDSRSTAGQADLSIRSALMPGDPDRAAEFGVQWQNNYRSISLQIDGPSEYPLRNLDLTVSVVNKSRDTLYGMGQISNIAGCEFHGPSWPDMEIRIPGKKGDAILSPRDAGVELPFGDEWKMFCQNIATGIQLRLMVIAASEDGTAPITLRTFGSYESFANDASRAIQFDRVVDVRR